MEEPTLTLTLQQGDAALIMKSDHTSELLRHRFGPDEEVPVHVQVLTAIALRIAQDEKFSHDLIVWLHEQMRHGRGLPS